MQMVLQVKHLLGNGGGQGVCAVGKDKSAPRIESALFLKNTYGVLFNREDKPSNL